MVIRDKIATVEDSLEKAHHVLAGMPVKYELNTDSTKKTEKAYWLFTQKEAIDTDISIALDYIEKGLNEISSCQKGGAVNE